MRQERALLVTFSGGAASVLVAAVAAEELGLAAVAVTALSARLSDAGRRAAHEFVRGPRDPACGHGEVCTVDDLGDHRPGRRAENHSLSGQELAEIARCQHTPGEQLGTDFVGALLTVDAFHAPLSE